MTAAPALALRIVEPTPLGDVTIVPSAMTGRSTLEAARSMAAAIPAHEAASDAEALRHLRKSYPQSSLATRVAALRLMMRGAQPAV